MADSTETILDNLTLKMTEVLRRAQSSSSPITDSPMVPISIRLDGSNNGLWSQVVEMYISRKDKLGYINEDYHPSPETDPSFCKWHTENAMVKIWLINSMDYSLVVNFIHYPTAKQVWDLLPQHTLMELTHRRMFSARRLLGMVLRGEDCITWMTSAQAEQITCTIKQVAKNDRFGYGIGAWAPIIWLSPTSTPSLIFTFAECRL
ncbi:hypothetical protein CIPAW_06G017400 [Carya illinoinensis]|uniref:Retrotransposon Copia-like N-terminal domain-containing protein n=1 Tax=Carya illinoinensis TaxID=32201 RepID=A0A8T1Q610_CARIL|nr:hypothetical protein CIPAW_06G017400 [Carya illinoinensis]